MLRLGGGGGLSFEDEEDEMDMAACRNATRMKGFRARESTSMR